MTCDVMLISIACDRLSTWLTSRGHVSLAGSSVKGQRRIELTAMVRRLRAGVRGHGVDIEAFESDGRRNGVVRIRATDEDRRFVGCDRDPEGTQRSARRTGPRNREEANVREGSWHDDSRSQVALTDYVPCVWLTSKQVENLHSGHVPLLPRRALRRAFGPRPMERSTRRRSSAQVTFATGDRPPALRALRLSASMK